MSAIDTAKEIARITVTSGLSKEIIELLEKKICLLTEQVTTLESENTNLKKNLSVLEKQLAGLKSQSGELDEISFKFLKLMFERDELSTEDAAVILGISKGMAEYHRDILSQAKMIQQTRFAVETGFESTPAAYGILPKGREYVVKNS